MAPLGQIGKRLQIIKIAISLTDDETIQLQRSKLRLYKNDKLLSNILAVLDDENYAQASNLIDRYMHGPYDNSAPIIDEEYDISVSAPQIISKERVSLRTKEEEELIRKFGLLETNSSNPKVHNPMSEEEMLWVTSSSTAKRNKQEVRAAQPKKPTTDEIMARYDDIIDTDFASASEIIEPLDETYDETQSEPEQADFQPTNSITLGEEMDILQTKSQKSGFFGDEILIETPKEELKEIRPKQSKSVPPSSYPPISYIDQKIRNMFNQYPQTILITERSKEEEALLYKISLEGYTEEDIEKTIDEVNRLKGEGKLGEAAHLLLIAAATESLYAQFMLARELYKGEILQRDLPEAFTQINRLALNDYPEAICDLAQFYEHGIGITKDKKKAFDLYQDAFELGIKRAEAHIIRMEEESKGIFGKLFSK